MGISVGVVGSSAPGEPGGQGRCGDPDAPPWCKRWRQKGGLHRAGECHPTRPAGGVGRVDRRPVSAQRGWGGALGRGGHGARTDGAAGRVDGAWCDGDARLSARCVWVAWGALVWAHPAPAVDAGDGSGGRNAGVGCGRRMPLGAGYPDRCPLCTGSLDDGASGMLCAGRDHGRGSSARTSNRSGGEEHAQGDPLVAASVLSWSRYAGCHTACPGFA